MRVLDEESKSAFGADELGFQSVRKRDGRTVPFNPGKILFAIFRAGRVTGELKPANARLLAERVLRIASATYAGQTPSVEQIQDVVENVLLASPYRQTAKSYILYREQHTRNRQAERLVDLQEAERPAGLGSWIHVDGREIPFSLQGLHKFITSIDPLRA